MRKPNTAKAAAPLHDLRQRAALARDAAGRFIKRSSAVDLSPVTNETGPDAELLALAPEWEAARDAYDHASSQQSEVEAVARRDDPPGQAPDGFGADWKEWFARAEQWRVRTGVAAAEEVSGAACRALGKIEDRIAALPAATLAGLRLKACVAQRCDNIELEWPNGLGKGLTRDLLALTAELEVDWCDPPPGFMASPAIDPMNFARIPQGIAIELERLRSIAMAELSRLTGPTTSAEQVARISRELRLDVLARATPLDDSISGQVDLTAATVTELSLIQGNVRLLAQVAHAMAWQGCCAGNGAGDLMTWLGDELTVLESRTADELQRRRPSTPKDRETRLAAVAERIISNGDVTETAIFIADLATFAAEQAGR